MPTAGMHMHNSPGLGVSCFMFQCICIGPCTSFQAVTESVVQTYKAWQAPKCRPCSGDDPTETAAHVSTLTDTPAGISKLNSLSMVSDGRSRTSMTRLCVRTSKCSRAFLFTWGEVSTQYIRFLRALQADEWPAAAWHHSF